MRAWQRAFREGSMIHVVYFTCADHFSELMVSLRSVRAVGLPSGLIGRIYVYCDPNDYFTEAQVKDLGSGIIFRDTADRMSWGGVKTVENELVGFNEIRMEVAPDDLIMNFDSDAMLISQDVLTVAFADKSADVVGHGISHTFMASWDNKLASRPMTFFQGSCYFVRASFVRRMLVFYGANRGEIIKESMNTCFVLADVIPPDVTMTAIARGAGANMRLMSYVVKPEMSVVHLEMTKNDAWSGFGRLMGISAPGRHKVDPPR
jgi:hypothetical protein